MRFLLSLVVLPVLALTASAQYPSCSSCGIGSVGLVPLQQQFGVACAPAQFGVTYAPAASFGVVRVPVVRQQRAFLVPVSHQSFAFRQRAQRVPLALQPVGNGGLTIIQNGRFNRIR